MVGAGLNTVPPAVCVLGLGALAYGIAPRAASFVVYGLVTWSVLIDLVGGIGALDHWVADTSVFHQMAAAPAVPPELAGHRRAWWLIGDRRVRRRRACCLTRRDLQGG